MKKRNKNLLLIAIFSLLAIFIAASFLIRLSSGMFSSVVYKIYNSNGLNIAFKVPQEWLIVEYPNTIVIGSNQDALGFGNNVNSQKPNKKNISVTIDRLYPLQNQTLQDYINSSKERSIASLDLEKITIDGISSYVFETTHKIQNQEINSRNIYLDRNGVFYAISATPADSELMPVFEDIVKSIKFQ